MEETGKATTQHDYDTVSIVTGHGYPIEVYDSITTDDGYLLTLHRIPHGKENKNTSSKPVVLLMHGFACNSSDFVVTGPGKGLGFVLSNLGYDVWMANCRGSRSSRRHVKLNPDDDEQYWRFSFHEMAVYDLPAIFDHVEKVTGYRTLVYIGCSQGTILPIVLLCEKPEYNERFNLVIALAPVVFLKNLKSIPYKILNSTRHMWLTLMERSGKLEFFPEWISKSVSLINQHFGFVFQTLLIRFLSSLNGKSCHGLLKDRLPVMLNYYPDSTSVIVLKHLFQMYKSGNFAQIDHGAQRNHIEYGIPTPPLYNLNNVICPVVLFCSHGDIVAHPEDARKLREHLTNCVAFYEVDIPMFNHTDFIYGKDADKVIYPKIFKHLEEYGQAK